MSRFKIGFFVMIILALSSKVCLSSQFDDAKLFSEQLSGNDPIKNNDPYSIPGYQGGNHESTKYYENANYGEMENDAIKKVEGDEDLQFMENESRKPKLKFDTNTPIVKQHRDIEENATFEGGVISSTSCINKEGNNETAYENLSCTLWMTPKKKICNNSLTVEIKEAKTGNICHYGGRIGSVGFRYDGDNSNITVDCVSGTSIRLYGAIMDGSGSWDFTINASPTSELTRAGEAYARKGLYEMKYTIDQCPSGRCTMNLYFRQVGQGWGYEHPASFKKDTLYESEKEVETWSDGCQDTDLNICEIDNKTCTEQGSRIISGRTVNRSCWNYRSTYRCQSDQMSPEPACQNLNERGCTPLTQECDASSCLQHYECPIDGDQQTNPNCSNNTTTIGDNKYDTSYSPSKDFANVATQMSVLQEASKDRDLSNANCIENPPGSDQFECTGDITVFKGEALHCDKKIGGFSDCCSDKGWGLNTGLDDCSTEEQKLGYGREAKRCHYVGRYCSEKAGKWCVKYSQSYCCFVSKLGRIFQEQGRPQLSIDWGEERTPNCQGFKISEFDNINMEIMDFSEFINDAMKMPDDDLEDKENKASQSLENYINKMTGEP
jgi:hypothetical protein